MCLLPSPTCKFLNRGRTQIIENPKFEIEEADISSTNNMFQSSARRKEKSSQANSYAHKRKTAPTIDPIFTQPYVPSILTNKTNISEEIALQASKSNKKAIPALFFPPTNQKTK